VKRATSYVLGAVSLAALAALAACSESPTATPAVNGPTANVVSDSHMAVQAVYRHVMPTLPLAAAGQAHGSHGGPGGGGGKTNNGINYHGGPLLYSATNVAAVYWASSTIYNGGPSAGTHGSGSADGSLVGFFLRNLGGSTYFNINTTYYQGSTSTPVQNIVNYTQYWANNSGAPSGSQQVSDTQMINMLLDGFANGSLSYDPHTLYAIFTAGKVNLGGGFGTQYCAYHGYAVATSPTTGQQITILYAAMPYDYAYPSGCTMQTSPNGDPAADAEVNTLAHETEETTTDEQLNAWYDHRGYENADKCAWTFGSTYVTSNGATANMNLGGKDFLVQQNWVNASGGYCAVGL
jgi:Phosphate-induced protein 1 conserved region